MKFEVYKKINVDAILGSLVACPPEKFQAVKFNIL